MSNFTMNYVKHKEILQDRVLYKYSVAVVVVLKQSLQGP